MKDVEMTAANKVTLTCECCIETFTNGTTAGIARFWAGQEGWFSKPDSDLDLCPKHAHLLEDVIS